MGIKRHAIRLLTAFRVLPVTFLMLAVSVWLMSLRLAAPFTHPDVNPLHYYPGSAQAQTYVSYPEIHGHFQLWDGEWWRLLGSAFHHGDLLHLMFNATAIWSCARIVEQAFGWWRYLLFFVTAAAVSMLPSAMNSTDAVGLSGVFYALFGVLVVLRTSHEGIRQAVPLQFVYAGFIWLFLASLLTYLKVLPIANDAHAVGLLYGLLIGWIVFRFRRRWPAWSVIASQVVHLGVAAAILMALNPLWNGSYYAWLANNAPDTTDPTLLLRYWKTATSLDARLAIGWIRQADLELKARQPQEAWKSILNGAKANRTNELLIEMTRELWTEMPDMAAQSEALRELQRIFGTEADAWIARLKLKIGDFGRRPMPQLILDEPKTEFTLDIEVDVPREVFGITQPHPPALPPQEVNPQNPNSALLGESL